MHIFLYLAEIITFMFHHFFLLQDFLHHIPIMVLQNSFLNVAYRHIMIVYVWDT